MSDGCLLGEALVLWIGKNRSSIPSRNDDVVLKTYGVTRGARLLQKIRQLDIDFYKLDANVSAPDIGSMAERASADFRQLHPEMPEEAVNALAWAFTFDFK